MTIILKIILIIVSSFLFLFVNIYLVFGGYYLLDKLLYKIFRKRLLKLRPVEDTKRTFFRISPDNKYLNDHLVQGLIFGLFLTIVILEIVLIIPKIYDLIFSS